LPQLYRRQVTMSPGFDLDVGVSVAQQYRSVSEAFPSGRAALLWTRPRCWAHLVGALRVHPHKHDAQQKWRTGVLWARFLVACGKGVSGSRLKSDGDVGRPVILIATRMQVGMRRRSSCCVVVSGTFWSRSTGGRASRFGTYRTVTGVLLSMVLQASRTRRILIARARLTINSARL
jgi:hypothetical protein